MFCTEDSVFSMRIIHVCSFIMICELCNPMMMLHHQESFALTESIKQYSVLLRRSYCYIVHVLHKGKINVDKLINCLSFNGYEIFLVFIFKQFLLFQFLLSSFLRILHRDQFSTFSIIINQQACKLKIMAATTGSEISFFVHDCFIHQITMSSRQGMDDD